MNLILALVWLLLGVTVLAWQALSGDGGWYLPAGNYRVSYGWFMLLLVAYNLSRWWRVRTGRARRRLQPGAVVRGRGRRWNKGRTPQGPPNPDFNFADEPPPSPEKGATDGPAAPG